MDTNLLGSSLAAWIWTFLLLCPRRLRAKRWAGPETSSLRSVAPVHLDGRSEEERQLASQRGARARTLNDRLEHRLAELTEARDASSGAERERLDRIIAVLERNHELRAQRTLSERLPEREATSR